MQRTLLHARECSIGKIAVDNRSSADKTMGADLYARVDGAMNAEPAVVADDRSELHERGADFFFANLRKYLPFIEPQVARYGSASE